MIFTWYIMFMLSECQ